MIYFEGTSKVWPYTIFESRSFIAPERLNHHCEITLFSACQAELTFNTTLLQLLSKWLPDRPLVYRVEYTLVVIPEDDLGWMHFRIECQGQMVGEATLKFDGE